MFETVRNAFKIKDLSKKDLCILSMVLIVVRIGCQLPVPGVDASVISEWFNENNSLDFFNQLTGGSFSQMSIFALNITPYITASIIIAIINHCDSYAWKNFIKTEKKVRKEIGRIYKIFIELLLQ